MESFFSSTKTERIARKVYCTRDAARADVVDYIERFRNTIRRHSTNGDLSSVEFEKKVGLAYCLSAKPAAGEFAIAFGRAEFGSRSRSREPFGSTEP